MTMWVGSTASRCRVITSIAAMGFTINKKKRLKVCVIQIRTLPPLGLSLNMDPVAECLMVTSMLNRSSMTIPSALSSSKCIFFPLSVSEWQGLAESAECRIAWFANQRRHKKGDAHGNTQDRQKSELDIERFPNPTQSKEETHRNPESF